MVLRSPDSLGRVYVSLVASGSSQGEVKAIERAGKVDQETVDGRGADFRDEGDACLGMDELVQVTRKGGRERHSPLCMDNSIMSTHERDPEQGAGLRGRLARRQHPAVRGLHVPAVGDVAPGD